MELEYFGANCFRIKTKSTTVVVDDNIGVCGGKTVVRKGDVLLQTCKSVKDQKAEEQARLVIDQPGEFEIGDISVVGVQVRAHIDEEDQMTATAFQFLHGNSSVTLLGHVHPEISDDLQELAGGTDVLVVPVGGNGYTLDAVAAAQVLKKIEPDTVVPSQYEVSSLNYEVPASPLDEFIKTSGLQFEEEQESLKIGKTSSDGEATGLVVLKVK